MTVVALSNRKILLRLRSRYWSELFGNIEYAALTHVMISYIVLDSGVYKIPIFIR